MYWYTWLIEARESMIEPATYGTMHVGVFVHLPESYTHTRASLRFRQESIHILMARWRVFGTSCRGGHCCSCSRVSIARNEVAYSGTETYLLPCIVNKWYNGRSPWVSAVNHLSRWNGSAPFRLGSGVFSSHSESSVELSDSNIAFSGRAPYP